MILLSVRLRRLTGEFEAKIWYNGGYNLIWLANIIQGLFKGATLPDLEASQPKEKGGYPFEY